MENGFLNYPICHTIGKGDETHGLFILLILIIISRYALQLEVRTDDLPASSKNNMLARLLIAPSRKIVFPTFKGFLV